MPAACPCDQYGAAAIPTASTSTSLSHLEQLSGEELAAMASILLEAFIMPAQVSFQIKHNF